MEKKLRRASERASRRAKRKNIEKLWNRFLWLFKITNSGKCKWRRVNQQWLKELERFGFDYAEYRAHLPLIYKGNDFGDDIWCELCEL